MKQETDKELYRQCCIEALECKFITRKWEYKLFASCLYEAALWGRKKDEENDTYYKNHRLADRYR